MKKPIRTTNRTNSPTSELIPLPEVVYDRRAKDGTWCQHPYHNHPKGCPNFVKGCTNRIDFKGIGEKYRWYAIVEEFDLKSHAAMMKTKHPDWSERQCRNPLYWQGGVKKRLREKAYQLDPNLHEWGHIYLPIPEAHGVNVFDTMTKAGIVLDRKPDLVKKVVLVGIKWVCKDEGQTRPLQEAAADRQKKEQILKSSTRNPTFKRFSGSIQHLRSRIQPKTGPVHTPPYCHHRP